THLSPPLAQLRKFYTLEPVPMHETRLKIILALICTAAMSCARQLPTATPAPVPHDPLTTLATTTPAKIDSFRGPYDFLSNFYPAEVVFENLTYPSVEHAYQSAKSVLTDDRRRIATMPTPAEAKKEGRKLTLRP